MQKIIDDQILAERLAKVIVSDIVVYNNVKIHEGLKNDNIFEILNQDIERGRLLYDSRVSTGVRQNTNYYERALVDVLITPHSFIKTRFW